jgi:hypothetical protein
MNQADITDVPDESERQLLRNLVFNSDLNENEKEKAFEAIDTCNNYEMYLKIQHKLEARQLTIDQIPNPSQKDISNHIKNLA